MTIAELIAEVDAYKPNAYTDAEKLRWINEFDGKVYEDVIKQYDALEGETPYTYAPYTATSVAPLIRDPYQVVYVLLMEWKIDYYNGEYAKYNNSATAFNEKYSEWRNYFNRTHHHKETKIRYF